MISDLTLQEGSAPVIRELESKPVEIASEAGHFYDTKTGKQVEFPKGTRLKTIIKKGCVPGVTSITKLASNYHFEKLGKEGCALKARELIESGWQFEDEKEFKETVLAQYGVERRLVMDKGTQLHKAIEQSFRGEQYDTQWTCHIARLQLELSRNGIDTTKGSMEKTFATKRYGGKVDYHDTEWLLDFKGKIDALSTYKKLSYLSNWEQLTAYDNGLEWDNNLSPRRLANVFIGIPDAEVKLVEITEDQIEEGWALFNCFCDAWWATDNRLQYRPK